MSFKHSHSKSKQVIGITFILCCPWIQILLWTSRKGVLSGFPVKPVCMVCQWWWCSTKLATLNLTFRELIQLVVVRVVVKESLPSFTCNIAFWDTWFKKRNNNKNLLVYERCRYVICTSFCCGIYISMLHIEAQISLNGGIYRMAQDFLFQCLTVNVSHLLGLCHTYMGDSMVELV